MWETLDRIDSPEDFIYDPSLVLYAPLHKKDGSSFMSDDAYGHLCTVTGALWTPRGRSFDGVDDCIIISSNLGITGGDITICVWFKPTAAGGAAAGVVSKYDNTAKVDYRIRNNASVLSVARARPGITWDETNAATAVYGQWYHLTLNYRGTTLSFYLDGELFDAITVSGSGKGDYATETIIGRGTASNTNLVTGLVGEVMVYNRALTALEIQRNYLSTKFRYR